MPVTCRGNGRATHEPPHLYRDELLQAERLCLGAQCTSDSKCSDTSERMALADSRVVHLPFDGIVALEGQSRSADYDMLDRRYSQNPPVFWERTMVWTQAFSCIASRECICAVRSHRTGRC